MRRGCLLDRARRGNKMISARKLYDLYLTLCISRVRTTHKRLALCEGLGHPLSRPLIFARAICATHAHSPSARSIGFCVIWVSISSSSSFITFVEPSIFSSFCYGVDASCLCVNLLSSWSSNYFFFKNSTRSASGADLHFNTKFFHRVHPSQRLRETYYIALCCCSWPLLILPVLEGAS
jgi:hypothetical protein